MSKSITKKTVVDTVKITKRGATVQSDKVAKIFGKDHNALLRQIRKKIDFLTVNSIHSETYFLSSNYINSRGKEYPRFNLTRKGFDLMVLSFKGDKAELYKLWYIDEFHKKSDVIQKNKQISYENKENPIWIEFREQGKEIRTKLTDAINDYLLPQRVEENKETSQFVARYISSYTKLIYKMLNIEVPKGVTLNRDAMELRTLFKIEELEEKISVKIEDYANKGINYKDVYQKIKGELL